MADELIELFRFRPADAYFRQALAQLEGCPPRLMDLELLKAVENRVGIYLLRYSPDPEGVPFEPVYAGKADSGAGVRIRLLKHYRKFLGRIGIALENVRWQALYLDPGEDVMVSEDRIIAEFGLHGPHGWNSTGFGPNDPGTGREDTVYESTNWHVRFPIDPAWNPCVEPGPYSAWELLKSVKTFQSGPPPKGTPYLVRFGGFRPRPGRPDAESQQAARATLQQVKVFVPEDNLSVEKLLALTYSAIDATDPEKWQLTRFPSHYILYPDRRTFPSGTVVRPEG